MPSRTPTPAAQLAGFLAKFTPDVAADARSVLAKLRRLLPPSVEMVYDNYNFLVIGFAPSERPSEAVLSVALQARGVTLCFLHGARLLDPHRLLSGSGRQVRSVRLDRPAALDSPLLRQMIASAVKSGPVPYPAGLRRRLVIKSVSAKQRPRRRPASRH